MTVEECKKQLFEFKDFYGGDLIVFDEIEKAKTYNDIDAIIRGHECMLENTHTDALSHLRNFRMKLGINDYII